MTTKMEKIEIDLPQDILFAMRKTEKTDDVKKKMKISLAIILFQEKTISLGKATELANIDRCSFMEVLKEHDITPYEYTEQDLERDLCAVSNHCEQAE